MTCQSVKHSKHERNALFYHCRSQYILFQSPPPPFSLSLTPLYHFHYRRTLEQNRSPISAEHIKMNHSSPLVTRYTKSNWVNWEPTALLAGIQIIANISIVCIAIQPDDRTINPLNLFLPSLDVSIKSLPCREERLGDDKKRLQRHVLPYTEIRRSRFTASPSSQAGRR